MKVNPIPPASPPDRAPAPAGSTRGSEFALNGRFYGQRVTGVQRYAREIARALDADRRMSGLALRVLTPAGSAIDPELGGVEWRGVGPLRGHAWEQLTLPARCRGQLLNLCNTAPAVKTDQVVCIHDANIFLQPESYSLAFRTLYRSLLPAVGRRSARVTTVSSFSASQIDEHLGIERRKIEVVPNGHEHVFRWSAASSRVGERLRPGRPFVLLLGSNARHKNAGLILGQAEALDALGLDLVVVGGSDKIFASVTGVSRSNILRLGAVSRKGSVSPSWKPWLRGAPWCPRTARACPRSAATPPSWRPPTTRGPGGAISPPSRRRGRCAASFARQGVCDADGFRGPVRHATTRN